MPDVAFSHSETKRSSQGLWNWPRSTLIATLCAIALNVAGPSSLADNNLASGQASADENRGGRSATVAGETAAGRFVDTQSAQQLAVPQSPRSLSPPAPPRGPAAPPQPASQSTSQVAPPATTQPAPRPAPSSDFALEGATRSLGGAGAPASSTPYMMGDFFSSAGQIFVSDQSNPNAAAKGALVGTIPNAGGTRRVKISENNSPIPRDRLFFSFNEFNNAALLVQQTSPSLIDIQRYTPGFEKTFWSGQGSIELRMPFASAQNPQVLLGSTGPAKATQFGNVALALKFLLWREDNFALAVGTGLNLPTGPDVQIFQFNQQMLTLKNQSVHLLPYVGAYWAPTDRTYVQSFLQLDVDTNGNAVNVTGGGLAGRLNEQTFLYADVAMGYWLYRDPDAHFVTGIIPTLEFHYNTTLQNADMVAAQTAGSVFTLGNNFNRLDILNVTTGTHFRLGPLSFLTLAGVFPLKARDSDRQFDSEIIVQFNRLF